MNNLDIVEQLEKIGQLPSEHDIEMEKFPLDEFDQLLQKIQKPISYTIAQRLLELSPPCNSGSHGVEWSLLNVIESVGIEELKKLLDKYQTENEVSFILKIRLKNYLETHPNK